MSITTDSIELHNVTDYDNTMIDNKYNIKNVLINKINNVTVETTVRKPERYKVHHIYNIDTMFSDESGQNGVITIVSKFDEDNPQMVRYGVSVCMPGDNFVKRYGIDLAKQRLHSNDKYSGWFRYAREKSFNDIKTMLLFDMAFNMKQWLPTWVNDTLQYEIT